MRHSCCVNACRVRGSRSALSLALRFRSSAQLAPNLTVHSPYLLDAQPNDGFLASFNISEDGSSYMRSETLKGSISNALLCT